jgi:RHS repeat-associated protein
VNRPASITIYDGSNNRVAETDYGYDESAVAGVSSVVIDHDEANYGTGAGESGYTVPRANLTTKTQKCFPACADAVTTAVYDASGQIVSYKDANDDTVGLSYADNFQGGGSPPGNTNAYITQITPPAVNGVSHQESFGYNYADGQLLSTTDANGQTTGYSYSDANGNPDPFGRIMGITEPANGQTLYSYNDDVPSLTTQVRRDLTGDNITTLSIMDGFGREWQSQLTSDSDGADITSTTYDGMGHKYQVSNPYRNTGESTYALTTYSYDPLGRVTAVAHPGGTIITHYSGNCTTVTDESGKARQSCSDALGRMTRVIEDFGGAGYETDYKYDALGNLLCTEQHGNAVGGVGCSAYPNAYNRDGNPWRVRQFFYDSLSRLTLAQNPESGSISYSYDANGNVLQKADLLNTVSYCYDALNRLTGKKYAPAVNCSNPGNFDVQYGYDRPDTSLGDTAYYPIGRRITMDDASGHTAWNYDQRGRVTTVQRWVAAAGGSAARVSYPIRYQYNPDSSVSMITYPSGRVVGYGYDNAGRNNWVWKSDPTTGQLLSYASEAHYTAGGALTSVLLGNAGGCFGGIQGSFSYNSRLQPYQALYSRDNSDYGASIVSGNSCTSGEFDIMHRLYSFTDGSGNDNGNVMKISNCLDSERNQNFSYDNLNRIAQAWTDGSAWGEQYNIDAWGNLGSIGGIGGKQWYEGLDMGVANNRNEFFGMPYSDTGNLLNDGAHWYSYDAENRIAAVDRGSVTYQYDGDGQRVVKNLGGDGTVYFTGTEGEILAETDLTGRIKAEYVFFNGKRLARTDNPTDPMTAELRYYLSDHLGSASMVMDETFATALEDTDYYPYGGIAYQAGDGDINHFLFTGKERDQETGLDYFGVRYYGSGMGRFMTPDPKLITARHLVSPQKWNKYAYVQNNPLASVDPDGLDDYYVFIGDPKVGGNWGAAQAAAVAHGHTFTIYRGADASIQNYNRALSNPNARVVFAGHTSHEAGSHVANAVVLANGRSAGQNSVVQVVTPTETPGLVQAAEQPLPQTDIQANTVALFGCNSIDLAGQYSLTDFIGLNSGQNNGTTVQAEGDAAAAWVAADATDRPADGDAPAPSPDPVGAANNALNQSTDPQDHDGDRVEEPQ